MNDKNATLPKEMLPHSVAVEFLNFFEMIGCPYTSDVDPSYLSELLLQPSPYRMRLLTWVISRLSPEFERRIDSYTQKHGNYVANLQVEGIVSLLTSLASLVFLCSSDDFELIKGTAPTQKQISFWERLLVLATSTDKTCANSCTPKITAIHSAMEKLLKTCDIASAVSHTSVLLPPSVVKELQVLQKLLPQSKALKISPQETITTLEEQKQELSSLEQLLADEKVNCQYLTEKPDDPSLVEKLKLSTNLMLGDLNQLEVTFNETFDNNMKAFCNRSAPEFSNLGKVIQNVDRRLSTYLQIIEDLKDIKKLQEIVSSCCQAQSQGLDENEQTTLKQSLMVLKNKDRSVP